MAAPKKQRVAPFQKMKSTARFVEINLRMERKKIALGVMSAGGGHIYPQGLNQPLKKRYHGYAITVKP